MNLQIITNLYPLPWEPGRAAFNRQQFNFLAKRSQIRILVLVPWLEARGRDLPPTSDVGGQPAVNYKKYFYTPKIARFTYGLTLYWSIRSMFGTIRKNSPDCLLASWAFPDGVAGAWMASALNIPLVIKVHGSDINMHMRYKFRAWQIRWAMKRARAIISVSEALKKVLVEQGVEEQKIHVVYNGIDHTEFYPESYEVAAKGLNHPGLGQNRKILFIGNLKHAKGCNDLLHAFSDIAGMFSDVDLIYIGSGKEQKELESIAASAGLEDRVHMLGARPHAEIRHWINLASLVALPSHNEGVPNVLLEAMACGKPVVATTVGGIPEVVGAVAGILVKPQNRNLLADALTEALKKEWDANAVAKSVAQFNWDNNADQMMSIFSAASG